MRRSSPRMTTEWIKSTGNRSSGRLIGRLRVVSVGAATTSLPGQIADEWLLIACLRCA